MNRLSKCRSRPEDPDASIELMDKLEHMLETEHVFTPNIQIVSQAKEPEDVTAGARDGSINVLRCLKMWYDLSSDVFLISVNIIDRFLTKMKVRSKHFACISVSSLYIASKLLSETINPSDLVTISQSRCTSTDLQRMVDIINQKLQLQADTVPITALAFIRLFHKLFDSVTKKLNINDLYCLNISEQALCNRLEIIACDSQCANYRPSVIAFALICMQFEDFFVRYQHYPLEMFELNTFMMELKQFCNISDDEFVLCKERIVSALKTYNGELRFPHRQRLTWKVSNRTLRKLRPTRQLTYILPTINEDSNHSIGDFKPREGRCSKN